MCEYCNRLSPKPIMLSEDEGVGFNVSMYIFDASDDTNVASMEVNVDYNGHELGVDLSEKIHYCPMCGQKLGA